MIILSENIKIPAITGELFYFIKKAYTGGAVDVYKPYGKNIYRSSKRCKFSVSYNYEKQPHACR